MRFILREQRRKLSKGQCFYCGKLRDKNCFSSYKISLKDSGVCVRDCSGNPGMKQSGMRNCNEKPDLKEEMEVRCKTNRNDRLKVTPK